MACLLQGIRAWTLPHGGNRGPFGCLPIMFASIVPHGEFLWSVFGAHLLGKWGPNLIS